MFVGYGKKVHVPISIGPSIFTKGPLYTTYLGCRPFSSSSSFWTMSWTFSFVSFQVGIVEFLGVHLSCSNHDGQPFHLVPLLVVSDHEVWCLLQFHLHSPDDCY